MNCECIFAGILCNMLDFTNTEIGFKARTDKDLKLAARLFGMLDKPWRMRMVKRFTLFAIRVGLPIKGIIKKTIFKQFCGGETISECEKTVNRLHADGVGTILDYSVEGKEQAEAFDLSAELIIQTIAKAKGNPAIPFSVFKTTGLIRFGLLERINDINTKLTAAEEKERDELFARVEKICKAAHDAAVPLFIDAEDSWIQDGIDRMVTQMMRKYNKTACIVYGTVQMYRHDRLAFLDKSIQEARAEGFYLGMKLVRGAYMEKERERAQKMGYQDPIQPDKAATDRDYNAAIKLCIDNADVVSVCNGTHNEDSCNYMITLLQQKNLDINDKRFYFAQLLGMSDHISYNLAHAGYRVAKYVPFGPVKEVLPYLLRRAEENTSVAGQTGRELKLIRQELKRRSIH
jgi:proline dehydrogenase